MAPGSTVPELFDATAVEELSDAAWTPSSYSARFDHATDPVFLIPTVNDTCSFPFAAIFLALRSTRRILRVQRGRR